MTLELYSLPGNIYKLDGGAMFGNAPKALWERWMKADEQNRIRMATRAMLAVTSKEKILFEAGIGAYLEPKLRQRFGVDEPEHGLLKRLAEKGISHEEITHVFLTHLHFDHAGGLLEAWEEGKEPGLLFPNARYHVSKPAWERATHPQARDRASFIPALNERLERSQRLEFMQAEDVFNFDELELRFFQSDGHTPGLYCFDLRYDGNRLVYVSDLMPGRFWVHLPITMGYDRYPELIIAEKTRLLASVAKDDGWIFYVHDPDYAISKVRFDAGHQTYEAVELQKDLIVGRLEKSTTEKHG